MVATQIAARGIDDERVLQAMTEVPRHLFVPEHLRGEAYEDRPLPIGEGQTISQPYIVASMTALLRVDPTHRVLEIGTGSGYQAAVLARLARSVVTIERHAPLARRAAMLLSEIGATNVEVVVGDGSEGYPPEPPTTAFWLPPARRPSPTGSRRSWPRRPPRDSHRPPGPPTNDLDRTARRDLRRARRGGVRLRASGRAFGLARPQLTRRSPCMTFRHLSVFRRGDRNVYTFSMLLVRVP